VVRLFAELTFDFIREPCDSPGALGILTISFGFVTL